MRARRFARHLPTGRRAAGIAPLAPLASNATILGACRVGRYAVVAAGRVVTRDVPPYTVVAGVLGRPVRSLPS